MESMSMGLPTLAVNWSGNTEFMNHENSFLVDIESLSEEHVPYAGHKWARASMTHLREQLRLIYSNKELRDARATQARQDIVHYWNIPAIAKQMVEKVKHISENKEVYRKKQELRRMVHLASPPSLPPPDSFTKDDKTFYRMKLVSSS